MITLTASIETIPPDHHGPGPDHQTRQVEVTAETYDQAREQILTELPDGWRVKLLRRL